MFLEDEGGFQARKLSLYQDPSQVNHQPSRCPRSLTINLTNIPGRLHSHYGQPPRCHIQCLAVTPIATLEPAALPEP